jgi:hypothetical protein
MRKISNIFISDTIDEITVTDSIEQHKGVKFNIGCKEYKMTENEMLKIISYVLIDTTLSKDEIISNLRSLNSIRTKNVLNNATIDLKTMRKCYEWNYVILQITHNKLIENLCEKNIVSYHVNTHRYTIVKID